MGNRLTYALGTASATSSTYDRADRVQTVGGASYTVDSDGNLTAYPSTTLAYDQANRLTSATISGTATTFAYDGDGKRASKTAGGSTTTFRYDANRGLPVVLTDGTLKYVWGNGLAYATDTSGNVQAVYHADGLSKSPFDWHDSRGDFPSIPPRTANSKHAFQMVTCLGSVRALTDASGNVTQTYQTDEFGVPTVTQGSSAQSFRFTGEQRDSETAFVFLRARYYAPGLGRFLSRDALFGQIASPLSLDRFNYVQDNPLDAVDPSGNGGPVGIDDQEEGQDPRVTEAFEEVSSGRWAAEAAAEAEALQDSNPNFRAIARSLYDSYMRFRSDPASAENPYGPFPNVAVIGREANTAAWRDTPGTEV